MKASINPEGIIVLKLKLVLSPNEKLSGQSTRLAIYNQRKELPILNDRDARGLQSWLLR